MKKLYVLIFIIFFSISVSYGQYGMNISGSHVIVHADTYLIIDDGNSGTYCDLKISNTDGLTIKPDAFVTTENLNLINASSTPDGEANLIVESNAQGTGSLIVNHNVTHSGKGRAKVQSYIEGTAGNYFMHCVGATVQDTTSGYINSVRLQQFDMTYLDTYAWYWDGSAPDISNFQAWINIWPYDYEVPLGWGLALTNDSVGTGTIEMVGYPKSGDISFTTHYVVGNTIELISNPYTSAIDFNAFYNTNSSDIENKFNIYENGGGNYFQYAAGIPSLDSAYIQVGQGFFVETKNTTSSVTFMNSHRVHNKIVFRNEIQNKLDIKVDGGTNGFRDALYIHFDPEATGGYDKELDAVKWRSISVGATMIYSIAEDDSALAINTLPLVDLNTTLTTVPVHFECGEEAEYNFTFNGIESFDMGTEAYLEDTQIGNHWISIPDEGFEYNFTAAPGEYTDRFYIHFFGPTYTPEIGNDSENGIKIYASGNYAYVLNNTNETLKHVSVHNLMGKTIYEGALPQQTLNKLFVSHQTGYYVVQVETDKKIYTQKVLIFDK